MIAKSHLRFTAAFLMIIIRIHGQPLKCDTNQVAFFQAEKLVEAFVLVYVVIACRNAFSVNRSLDFFFNKRVLLAA